MKRTTTLDFIKLKSYSFNTLIDGPLHFGKLASRFLPTAQYLFYRLVH